MSSHMSGMAELLTWYAHRDLFLHGKPIAQLNIHGDMLVFLEGWRSPKKDGR